METIGIFNEKQFKEYSSREDKGWSIDSWKGYNRTDGVYEIWEPVVSFYVNKDEKIVPVTNFTHDVSNIKMSLSLGESPTMYSVGVLDRQLFNAPPNFVRDEFGESYEDITKKLATYTEESLIEEFVTYGALRLTKNGSNSESGMCGSFVDSRGSGCSM